MRISVGRKAHFNAAHRLHNPNWTEQENKDFYGLCNSPNYHGHNYDLHIKVKGEVDEESGYLIDLKILKGIIHDEVEDAFDHKNLNLDVPEFLNLIPTAENIAAVIWKKINRRLPAERKFELTVLLYETERNYVEYTGE